MSVEAKTDSERIVLQFLTTLSAGDLDPGEPAHSRDEGDQ